MRTLKLATITFTSHVQFSLIMAEIWGEKKLEKLCGKIQVCG